VKETGVGLGQDMHLPSRVNNRNMSAEKWLIISRSGVIYVCEMLNVVESCLLVLRTAFSMEKSDVLKKR